MDKIIDFIINSFWGRLHLIKSNGCVSARDTTV